MRKVLGLHCLFALMIAFSSHAQSSLNVDLLFHWHDPSLPASFAHGNIYNEVWGLAWEGREYAVIGSTNGTHIFDVTDPVNSEEIHFIPGEVQGGTIVHRDYKTYDHYFYVVCDEGPSTLQIIDFSGLPESVEVVYDSNTLFSRAHNIYIDEANAKMYTCGGNYQFDCYSLENPEQPVLLNRCQNQVAGWSTQVGYVHDAFVRDNIAYCNAEDGLWLVDFTDAANPVFLGDLSTYPESGYNHSGWLNEAGDTYVLADETHGKRLKVLDVSNYSDIQVESLVGTMVNEYSIPHNVLIRGNIAHVSYYHDGYYAWDISDAANPELLGYYDTSDVPHAQNYKGAWGTYPFLPSGIVLVSDMQEGLFVFQLNQPTALNEINTFGTELYPNPVAAGETIRGRTIADDGVKSAELLSFDGKVIWRGILNVNDGEFRMELPKTADAGMYVLRIFAELNHSESIKLLVR